MIVRSVAFALAAASAAGCALVRPPEAESTTAVLNKMPAELPRRARGRVVLLVFPPQASPAYDTAQMAYSRRPDEVAYFRDHQWSATPPQMLQPLLVRTLESTGYFSAIVTPPHTGPYSYSLRTEITELVQDFTSDPAVLRLTLRVRLGDDATGRLVATEEISQRQPLQEKTPAAGIAAANDAVANALQRVAVFVLEKAD